MKRRNPLLVIVLVILTGGLYALYWLGKVSSELRSEGSRSAPSPWWLLTFPLVIPVYLYLFWLHRAVRTITPEGESPGDLIALVLFLLFIPGLIAYWQEYLNRTISRGTASPSNYCEICGESLNAGAKYCPGCGSPV